ncbi:MAG TPA: hypothetical protein ENN90_04485 [Mariniphaga anaerophila]|uniref:Phosphoribosyl-AMP cyclohydrolase n=1 Tax=Mariniphaga anaerophila TaxID=1484053 RepID=A0A831LLC7_9BACT|nr:hypothetical protein [Mariniphaga anaerophila]
MNKVITEQEIIQIQQKWAESLIRIGEVFKKSKDYKSAAIKHVDTFYGYSEGTVLFKPTLANNRQFRKTFESALSYFIGGNPNFPQDVGFALVPWKEVRFKNSGFILKKEFAVVMGNYFFTNFTGREVKVEFTFGFFRNNDGRLKINLHHSSIPYSKD